MFQRGFKTRCEDLSIQVRREHGLNPVDPLDPFRLAKSLGIRICTPKEIPGVPPEICQRILTLHSDTWSAITISLGSAHLTIYNPSHSAARQASDLAHEIAHLLLDHEPTQMFVAPDTGIVLRTHDENQEEEASWLSGCLLLPRPALISICRGGIDEQEACKRYRVSRVMLRFRLNASGVNIQIKRAKSFR